MTCPSAAKKGCGSHLFGVGPSEADKIALVQELSKATSFFILGPILVKLHICPCLKIVNGKRFELRNFIVLRPVLLKNAYHNSANPELSNGVQLVELR